MSEAPEQELPHGVSPWLAMVAVLPLFYLLSIGPVGVYAQGKPPNSFGTARKFYAPIIWLHDHTVLQKPLEAYVELWGVR